MAFQTLSMPRVGAQGESKSTVRWDLMRPAGSDTTEGRIAQLEGQLKAAEARLKALEDTSSRVDELLRLFDVRAGLLNAGKIALPRGKAHVLLMDIIAKTSGVNQIDLVSDRKDAETVKARQMFFWLAKRFTRSSLIEIGGVCGGRDHTTILHGYRKVETIVSLCGLRPEIEDPTAWAKVLWEATWPPGAGAAVKAGRRPR